MEGFRFGKQRAKPSLAYEVHLITSQYLKLFFVGLLALGDFKIDKLD